MHIRTSPNSTILIFNNFSAADFSYVPEDWSLDLRICGSGSEEEGQQSTVGGLRDGENVKR